MRSLIILFWCGANTCLAAPIPKESKVPATDGTWEVVEYRVGRTQVSAIANWKIEGAKVQWTQTYSDNVTRVFNLTLKPRPDIHAKAVEVTFPNGSVFSGCLEVKGDHLKICMDRESGKGGEHPKTAEPGSNTIYYEFKRIR